MLDYLKENLKTDAFISYIGKIVKIVGLTIESIGPPCQLGELCTIVTKSNESIPCEVVGFEEQKIILMALTEMHGISVGDKVYAMRKTISVKIGDDLIGRVIDGLGNPIDGDYLWKFDTERSIYGQKSSILNRKRIDSQLQFGVKAIDAVIPCGKGQRIGIFAGSGVGKSTLLGMIAKNTTADINVIALIGERGREVKEFIDNELGEEGLKKSIVVVATSDEPALARVKGALLATTIAEYFRDKGLDVMLMLDSITRFAMSQREIGISTGEKVAQKGYTPSVFSMLPKLLERTGTSDVGTITAIYTVLVEGDDMDEPIADAVRGILDGHIVLSRKLANLGHYPAIDVLQSVSRLKTQISSEVHLEHIDKFVSILAKYSEKEELIDIGKIDRVNNPEIDYVIKMNERCKKFLKQPIDSSFILDSSINELVSLFSDN